LTAPRIDGVLDDPMWKKFDPAGLVDKSGEAAQYKTWMYAGWDEKNLYLALANYEPQIAKLTTGATRRDQSDNPGMWDDDSVEIFICPDPKDRSKCYQWIVNAKGMIWDGSRGISKTRPVVDETWDSRIEVKTKIESNRWVIEVGIPWKDLGIVGPIEGKMIALNVYRNRVCGMPVIYSCWSPILGHGHFSPERFGLMSFKKK
jgi:hypothetical protein